MEIFSTGIPEAVGKLALHCGKVRQKFRSFSKDVGIDVFDSKAVLLEAGSATSVTESAGWTSPCTWIGIGKAFANVAQARSAQQGIDDGVAKHIAVGVRQ